MSIDKSFRYTSAAESAKPGYLARRFAAERKRLAELAEQQKAADVEVKAKVRTMKKVTA